ncbi:peptidase M3 [Vibrio ponticus]|uniref:Peptidase M3 n=1 Tax=Vibrio ponticus TaxID=265668 RepID=A0ABX3FEK8_9VIBR|nr:M3 family metallopeptidase [Vibrio ponticus]OLQ89050.1 peptidase M3 [Vibrio ponticus]
MNATQFLNQLNRQYLAIHRCKEDFFWETYMGISDDHQGAAQAQTEWTQFLGNADNLRQVKHYLEMSSEITDEQERQATTHALNGWLAVFNSHGIEDQQTAQQQAELIQFESELFKAKQNHPMLYINDKGEQVEGSLPVLSSAIRTSDNPVTRQSAHQALLDLEQWLLGNGFLDLVKRRNRFARALGYANYFDYSVQKTEHMSSETLFSILDDFEQRTRTGHLQALEQLAQQKGAESLQGHNFVYAYSGDAMRDLDPYVPFSQSLRRWIESFGRLNIDYAEAELTLDLLDRKGKYQNGFCHGPIPSFYDQGHWVAAKVNFTSNAKPDQVGSGYSGINTFFHEGGHAAHFANMKQNSPCFSIEFAPTSMAYAETQSMFCDSLLNDADWLKRYALNHEGKPVPDSIIEAITTSKQPFKAYEERSILVVPYFERALYQLSDEELQPARVTELARQMEKTILGLECSPRPLMAIPHLLSDEAACAYQGYLLAHMAVYQTRAYFLDKFGYLTDNPEIGPLLCEHYWQPGNSVTHNDTIKSLTGEGFNAKYLADECNLTAEQAWQKQQDKIAALATRTQTKPSPLNAKITVVDGATVLASNQLSDWDMCEQFERYISHQYGC